jgi:hypothetical protein
MPEARAVTRYRSLTRKQALAALGLLSLAIAWCLSVSGVEPRTPAGKGGGDVALFGAVEQRVRGGEGYYEAMGSELRSRGYQSRSIFNWRTPLHLSLIARLPTPGWAWLLLVIVTSAAIAMAFVAMCRDRHPLLALLAVPLMSASMASFMGSGLMFSEVWAGVLIAASAGAFWLGFWHAGAALGILALFFRELALPYVLIGIFLAYRHARRSELGVWLAGMGGYAIYFALHALAAKSSMTSSDIEATWREAWIQFGGVRFLLAASRVGLLLGAPAWATALYLPFSVLGLAGWAHPLGRRLLATVGAYLLAFSVLGRPVQFYWGGVYTPLLSLGVVWAAPALRDLLLALKPTRQKPA